MKILAMTAATVAGVLALPAASFAATFAYVNTAGEVMTMTATDANTAIATAPNIATHSGVMNLDVATGASVTGTSVSGI